jgi:hypothetical protein
MPARIYCLLSIFLMTTACATLPETADAPGIGPYRTIHARLLVIEPTRRWQVLLDWQAESAAKGQARLVHAASNSVIELRWQQNDIELRDNHSPQWRRVGIEQLAEQGIVVSPSTLSHFLAGRIPPDFRSKEANQWESNKDGNHVRVTWNDTSKRLEFSDIKHGRRATLIILSGEDSLPTSSAEKRHHV